MADTNRREFLKTSAVTGAGAAFALNPSAHAGGMRVNSGCKCTTNDSDTVIHMHAHSFTSIPI